MHAPSILSACLIATLAGGTPAAANPVLTGADPHAVIFDQHYWIYPTVSGFREPVFAAYRSRDLRTWERQGVALRLRDVGWVDDDGAPRHHAWAPAVARRGGRYFLYYSVGPNEPTPSRIGVATGERPEGPFEDSGRPLVTGGDGFEAIDPMVFIDPADDTPYLYAGGSAGSRLRVWELGADMTSLKREVEVGQPPKFTEAPFMHLRDGTYYLSYSHGSWQHPSYSVHYATAKTPTGPWNYRGAILESDERHKGPGHHSFLRNPLSGDWFIVYHRWETTREDGPYRGRRRIAIERIGYRDNGDIEAVTMTDRPPPAQRLR